MRSKAIALLGLAGIFMIAACSSSSTEVKSNGKTGAGNSVTNGSANANANTVVVTNGMVVEPQVADANAAPGELVDPLGPAAPMKGRLDKIRGSAGPSEKVDVEALALQNARPAPDNSTFTSYLSDAGYEIRTFKSHPQLTKVEKRTGSDGSQTLKIFLRNGQVVERPGNAIGVLSTASADAILAVGGITPQQPKAPAASGPSAAKKQGAN